MQSYYQRTQRHGDFRELGWDFGRFLLWIIINIPTRQMQDPYVCLTEMQTKMMSVLAESGKGFDQTGVYQDCLASLQSIYYFIMFKNVGANDTNRVFMGLCAPDICSA